MWRPGTTRDAVVPGLILALDVLTVLLVREPMAPLGWALTVLASVALVWRQRFPIAVLVVTGAAAAAYYPLGFPDSPIAVTMVVALYTVARLRGLVASGIGAGAALVAFTVPAGPIGDQLQTAAGMAPILLCAVVLGEIARDRARRLAEAVASREAAAVRRATEERLRIARELHDVLAHQISLINVQAGAALHVREAEAAFEALGAIRVASKEALQEVRVVLGVLREENGASLARLPELVSGAEAAGLKVSVTVDVPELPAEVDLAAYRIVQEALTNAVRHGVGERVGVSLRPSGGDLVISVADEGLVAKNIDKSLRPGVAPGAGNGLLGMAERVAALGGTLETGPRPGGGFQIKARLPLNGTR